MKNFKNTREKCFIAASNCIYKWEFIKNYYSEYRYSCHNKFYKEICEKFNLKELPKNKLDVNDCIKEASKYNTISELVKSSPATYNRIRKLGILNDIKKNMTTIRKPIDYWTKDICASYAIKYKTRSEFQKKDVNVYQISRKLGFLDEICFNMEKSGNYKKRLIYCY